MRYFVFYILNSEFRLSHGRAAREIRGGNCDATYSRDDLLLLDSAPDFKQAQNELAALRTQVVRAETEEPASGKADSDYIAKFRDFKYHETLFELFAKQNEMARVDESREGAIIQVIDAAQPPEKKTKPKKALIVVGTVLVAGFMLLLFVFGRHALRGAGQDHATAEKFANLRRSWRKAIGRSPKNSPTGIHPDSA